MNISRDKFKLIIIISIIFPTFIIVLDFLNITEIIPLSSRYDWLGFVGAYTSGLCTLWLGVISIKQNNTLEKVNKKMLENDMISNGFSKIDIEVDNYIDDSFIQIPDNFGLQMINEEKKGNLYCHRIILQIFDEKKLPLVSAKAIDLAVEYDFDDGLTKFKKISKYLLNVDEETKLEVTPWKEKNAYYLPIYFFDTVENLKQIDKNNELRITLKLETRNSFNVICRGEYTLKLHKGQKESSLNWCNYKLFGRKIYFKDFIYKEGIDENN